MNKTTQTHHAHTHTHTNTQTHTHTHTTSETIAHLRVDDGGKYALDKLIAALFGLEDDVVEHVGTSLRQLRQHEQGCVPPQIARCEFIKRDLIFFK